MAWDLIWSNRVLDDIAAIAEYLARDSLERSRGVVARIVETAVSVSRRPEAGRRAPELNDDNIRECFVYSYRLIYEILPARIHILHVIHGRRRFDADGPIRP